ncbi:MAG: hypothetical protein ACKOIZ_11240, partial [Actinomycetota bacterium]
TGSLVCVGLDPDPTRFPTDVGRDASGIETFCRTIVDVTGDWVCAFKPQIAYFAAHGAEPVTYVNAPTLATARGISVHEQRRVRQIVGNLPLLVPGVGAQGGDAATVVRNGATSDGTGLVVNSSRAILYASAGSDYASAARGAATALRDSLNAAR